MKERLQKILSARGVTSRRMAEQWIAAGRITCNGLVSALGDQADPDTDEILLDGKPLPAQKEPIYIMLNKPRGYVTTLSDEKGRKNAAQLVEDCGERVYPVGRLDMDSEGLLLFTNDGAWANRLMHPKHEVEKRYEVWVNGFTKERLAMLRRPVTLEGYTIRSPKIRLLHGENGKALLNVTIHEGRNRQIRKMCAMAELQVTRLRRVAEGPVELGALSVGAWRYLTEAEKTALQK